MPIEDYRAMTELFTEDVYEAISLDTCVRERKSEGGPSPDAVKEQIALAEKALEL
jgi:argininosuccinate lyase